MKILATLACLISIHTSYSQSMNPPPPVTGGERYLGHPLDRTSTYAGTSANEMIYERGLISTSNQVYIINGSKVVGSPFLYHQWYNGSVTTTQGGIYANYKLRYNIFNQTLMFYDGKDSLEVNEAIKQFSLFAPDETGATKKFDFIHSDQFKEEAKPYYLEIIMDSTQGMLLKKTTKVLAEARDILPIYDAVKAFKIEQSFYYYDKNTKGFTKIKSNGSNITSILKLPKEKENELFSYDFTDEAQIKSFFSGYLSVKKPSF